MNRILSFSKDKETRNNKGHKDNKRQPESRNGGGGISLDRPDGRIPIPCVILNVNRIGISACTTGSPGIIHPSIAARVAHGVVGPLKFN